MLNRRRVVKGGLAALGSLSVAAPLPLRAQGKPPVKVRYNEVVRSIMYAPAYVALAKGYFKEAGLDITLSTAQGGDKSVAALLSGAADIALIGPETTIYVQNSTSPTKIPMFCGMTTTDGFLIMSRAKIDKFEWSMLKGKDFLGFRPGSTPLLYLEEALRKNGIDPQKDVKLNNNIAVPARVGSWLAGQNQFAIFTEPDASQLELDGKAHFIASVGKIVGPADYTTFMATDKYIKDNPEVIQTWTDTIYRAQKWTAEQSPDEIAKTIAPFFPGVTPQALAGAAKRFNELGIWKKTPKIEKEPIERFQDILVNGKVLDKDKRVPFEKLVLSQFADKAK
ncbi:MAG TPA: ABC transporter substrate-binding protein [Xanthobacteraceae bacterium]|nr:ABC transporter substrate-binding protein [Xanthobacteraceae bacterium]